MANNSTSRFSNRVDDYVKYRPGYPQAIVDFLQQEYGLSTDKLVADVGAGTGISTELFLKAGYSVAAVEPNKAMRDKAIELLGGFPDFKATDGTAEHTGLESASVDAIICGQAFHWFNREQTKEEFKRILTPGGIVALIWNERRTGSDFEKEYDALIVKHASDYVQVDHRNIDNAAIETFFSPESVHLQLFPNSQSFDLTGLEGRLLSSSYMPAKQDAGYAAMINDLERLYNRYQVDDHITIHYDTKVYVGRW